jgi:hypothetical protein
MNISTELVVAIITISVTVFGYFFHANTSRKMHELEQIRKNNAPVYEKIVQMFINILIQNKPGMKKVTDIEILKFFADVTPKLMVWGSNDVVKAFGKFRTYSITNPDDPKGLMKCLDELIQAIRNELGHENENISSHIRKLYLND